MSSIVTKLARARSRVRRYAEWTGPHPDEVAFHRAMEADPWEHTTPLAYADWLDEHDRPGLAKVLREHVRWHPEVQEAGARRGYKPTPVMRAFGDQVGTVEVPYATESPSHGKDHIILNHPVIHATGHAWHLGGFFSRSESIPLLRQLHNEGYTPGGDDDSKANITKLLSSPQEGEPARESRQSFRLSRATVTKLHFARSTVKMDIGGKPYSVSKNEFGYGVVPLENKTDRIGKSYQVLCDEGGNPTSCSCPDNFYRHRECKHMAAVKGLNVGDRQDGGEEEPQKMEAWHSSTPVVIRGLKYNPGFIPDMKGEFMNPPRRMAKASDQWGSPRWGRHDAAWWMSPSGKIHHLEPQQSHEDFIYKNLGKPGLEDLDPNITPDMMVGAMGKGWVRMLKGNNNTLITQNEGRRLTQTQRREAIDHAMLHRLDSVVHHSNGGEREVWRGEGSTNMSRPRRSRKFARSPVDDMARAVAENPADDNARMVYADALQEEGDEVGAHGQRLIADPGMKSGNHVANLLAAGGKLGQVAHGASIAAYNQSIKNPTGQAVHVLALNGSTERNHRIAAHHHTRAAKIHQEESRDPLGHPEGDTSDPHAVAMILHRKAADIHRLAAAHHFDPADEGMGPNDRNYTGGMGGRDD